MQHYYRPSWNWYRATYSGRKRRLNECSNSEIWLKAFQLTLTTWTVAHFVIRGVSPCFHTSPSYTSSWTRDEWGVEQQIHTQTQRHTLLYYMIDASNCCLFVTSILKRCEIKLVIRFMFTCSVRTICRNTNGHNFLISISPKWSTKTLFIDMTNIHFCCRERLREAFQRSHRHNHQCKQSRGRKLL